LSRLLEGLQSQKTEGLFTLSIVVVDNDHERSAEPIVTRHQARSAIPIEYDVEPERHIALARNRAIKNSRGDFVAFIDDDEFPINSWLFNLYTACCEYDVDGVLGPVKPVFEIPPPKWVIQAKLFERSSHKTGTVLHWPQTRTGNVLLRRRMLESADAWFRSDFKHSEDQDFFKRMMAAGRIFIWSDEAVVHETQTADRLQLKYFVKRALLRGNVSLKLQPDVARIVCKSVLAMMIYTSILPFLLIFRRHLFIQYFIKEFDHLGKLLAACRIDLQGRLA
jgi:glycosyltransferase involved in cell wall biosynthesis